MTFHHIGIACYDIEKSSQFYISQGYTKTAIVYDPIQNVNICFCKRLAGGGVCIELISPCDATSPVCKNIQKNGVSPYHICYETETLEVTVKELKSKGFLVVSKPAPAVAFAGRNVCFLFSKDVGLIELVEGKEP